MFHANRLRGDSNENFVDHISYFPKLILNIVKRQHVKVSTKYWSVVNESDVKQTKSISNRSNPFSDKIGNNKNIHTTCKAALPSRAGTTKHVYKKRDTKQAQHQEGANNSRAKWITNPFSSKR